MMIRTVKRAFTLAEAMITITIVSLVMAATMPIIIKSQNAPSEAPWKYVTLGDLSQNAAVYTVLGGSAVSVFGDKRVPIDTNITTNKSQVFAAKMNPKISIVARNHSYNPLISRHLIDFYEKHTSDADTFYNIGKISFDNYYNLAMGKNALDNIGTTQSATLSNSSNATLWTALSSPSAALNTAVGQYAMSGDSKNPDYSTPNDRRMSGSGNTALGAFAMRRNTLGSYNTGIGAYALESATDTNPGQGSYNIAVGYSALRNNSKGDKNAALGYQSLYNNTEGAFNIAIGSESLWNNTDGRYNIAIGHNAASNINASNKIYVSANNNYIGTNAIIYGDDTENSRKLLFNTTATSYEYGNWYAVYAGAINFNNHLVNYSEMVSYVTNYHSTHPLSYDSDSMNGSMLAYSDSRLKNILGDNTSGLKEILQLNVKNYTMKKDKNKELMVGVIAQDLQKVFPNSVFEGRDGYLRIKRDEIFYACVNAIKELHSMIQDVIAKIAGLDEKIRLLEDRNKINEEKIIALEKQNKLFEERLSALEKDSIKTKAEKKQKLLEQTEKVEKSEKTEKITNPITEESK